MKKRALQLISFFLLLCMVGSLFSCEKKELTTEDYLYEEEGITLHEQISMSVTKTMYAGETEIPCLITNNSNTDISFLQTFRLEKWVEDGWERAPRLSSWEDWEDAPVDEDGNLVIKDRYEFHYSSCAKLSTTKHTVYIRRANYGTDLYDPLEVGEYRVLVSAKTSDEYNIRLVAYFTVTEAPAE